MQRHLPIILQWADDVVANGGYQQLAVVAVFTPK